MLKNVKKLVSLVLVLALSFAICVPTFASTQIRFINKSDYCNSVKTQAQKSDLSLIKKLQISVDKLNHLSPQMISRLHKDFDDTHVVNLNKTYYALEKLNNFDKGKVVTVTEDKFKDITSPGIHTDSSRSKRFYGVGTLTSYVLSDNSLAMSMELLDSYHPASSSSFDVALSLNNAYGDMASGATLYSRYKAGTFETDEGIIHNEGDYATTSYTVPGMVTETDRYFYLSCDCENVTGHQILRTDFAVCTYNLDLSGYLPTSYADFINHFFISRKTTHYSGKAN